MAQTGKQHSKVGITSCVIGIGMFSLFLMATVAYYFQFRQEHGPESEGLAVLQMAIEMMLPIPVHIVGLLLGAVSAFFPNRRKLFPVLGIALNLVFGLCSLFPWLWLLAGALKAGVR